MNHLTALLLGFGVDLLLGDPRWLPHPVQGIGWLIGKLEAALRRCFPTTERGERRAGVWLAALTVGLTGLTTGLCLFWRDCCIRRRGLRWRSSSPGRFWRQNPCGGRR